MYDTTFAAADGNTTDMFTMSVTYTEVSNGDYTILISLTFTEPVGFITSLAYSSSIGSATVTEFATSQLPLSGVATVHTFPGLNPNDTASNVIYTLMATIGGLEYSGLVTFQPAEFIPPPRD